MKFIRFLFTCLVLVVVLAAVLCAAAFVPMIQSWALESALARQDFAHGSVGSIWAAFGKVEAEDVKFENESGRLTLPTVEASFPLLPAILHHRVQISRLVAKGWTLDLSHDPELTNDLKPVLATAPPAGPAAPASPPVPADEQALRAVRGFFQGWTLPLELSLDGADLEGDVLVHPAVKGSSVHVHVVITGGGLASGATSHFTINVSAPVTDPRVPYVAATAKGDLSLTLSATRSIEWIGFDGKLTAIGAPFPDFDSALALDRSSGAEKFSIAVIRAGDRLASFDGAYVREAHQLKGAWQLNLKDSDITPFTLDHPIPAFAIQGVGQFESDIRFERVHLVGKYQGQVSHLGAVAAPLEQFGTLQTDAQFDLVQDGSVLTINRLASSFAATKPLLTIRLVQPFTWDERTGSLKAADGNGDWMTIAILNLPLSSLAGFLGPWQVTGGDASGELLMKPSAGGFSLRPVHPVVAANVSIARAGKLVADHLQVSVPLTIDYAAPATTFDASPIRIVQAGKELLSGEVKTERSGDPDQPIVLAVTWSADADVLAGQSFMRGLPRSGAKTFSGETSLTLGSSLSFDGKVTVTGHNASHVLTAAVTGGIDADGKAEFLIPAKISFGSDVSEVTAEGSYSHDDDGANFDLKLSGPRIYLDQLRRAGNSLASAAGLVIPQSIGAPEVQVATASGERDAQPFWGKTTGVVRLQFDRLMDGKDEIKNFGGSVILDGTGAHLKSGRAIFDTDSTAKLEGELTFTPNAEQPYVLSASASVDKVEAAPLFGKIAGGDDPIVEGRFAVERGLNGRGANLTDLISHTHVDYRLTSNVGIVRALRTNVGDAIPEVATPVADSVGAVGGFVGKFIGVDPNRPGTGRNKVTRTADSVMDFINQISEIGYDQVTVKATQDTDGRIRLTEITMIAPDETLTGTGQIAYVPGSGLSDRPISVDLKLSAKHRAADMMASGGLPTFGKDAQGFTILSEPIHLGGTLMHLDSSKWHDFLAKAAQAKPAEKKKG